MAHVLFRDEGRVEELVLGPVPGDPSLGSVRAYSGAVGAYGGLPTVDDRNPA